MKLGVIADDFTGAVDIAGFLVSGGMRTLMCAKPVATGQLPETDAIVMSLKIRSIPSSDAVEEALSALAFLQEAGCDRFYYKYCSTFDSTEKGNIGPISDALRDALGLFSTLICPALPVNGRTVYHGYLFVGDQLLSDSPMRHHPLNPMRMSKLADLLAMQSPSTNGHVYYDVVKEGVSAVKNRINVLEKDGVNNIIVDVINDGDLDTIAKATEDMILVTGGSGLAQGIATVRAESIGETGTAKPAFLPKKTQAVVIAGSCSAMMQKQVAYYKEKAESLSIDEQSCVDDPSYPETLAQWVLAHQGNSLAPMVFATRSPEELQHNRERFKGMDLAGIIEQVFGRMTAILAREGVYTFIVGGGETSGVVASTLGVDAYLIGEQIGPGVSWVQSLDRKFQLVLKSGNFGSESFLEKAQECYDE
nr:3-oxo-tetronate kinase [uncultured Sphaerochaeta sp.]